MKKIDELRRMNEQELKDRLRELRLQLIKWKGEKVRRAGAGFDREWHPPFSETKKEIARIHTVLGEMKNIIGERRGS